MATGKIDRPALPSTYFGNTRNSNALEVEIPTSQRGLLFTYGTSTDVVTLYMYNTNSGGTVTLFPIKACGSNQSVTAGTNKITLNNTAATYMHVYVYPMVMI